MKVLITDMRHASIAEEQAVLEPAGVTIDTTFSATEEELIANGQGAIGFLVSYAQVTRKVMEALPELKIIVKYGIGVDSIDVHAAKDLGKYVANVSDYCTEEVALHALSLATTGLRMTHFFADNVKNQQWIEDTSRFLLERPSSLQLGVVGFGKLARQFVSYMEPLIPHIAYFDPYVSESDPEAQKRIRVDSLAELFATCRIISLHTPLTNETKNLINADVLSHAKDLILINTSRGGLIEKYALSQALDDGKVKFFGADVYWKEPPDFDDPWNIKFLQRENVYITSHVASQSKVSEKELRRKAAEEVLRVIQGKQPLHTVNR
jgi:D-3-phosphoglycerate dehydrogenase